MVMVGVIIQMVPTLMISHSFIHNIKTVTKMGMEITLPVMHSNQMTVDQNMELRGKIDLAVKIQMVMVGQISLTFASMTLMYGKFPVFVKLQRLIPVYQVQTKCQ